MVVVGWVVCVLDLFMAWVDFSVLWIGLVWWVSGFFVSFGWVFGYYFVWCFWGGVGCVCWVGWVVVVWVYVLGLVFAFV